MLVRPRSLNDTSPSLVVKVRLGYVLTCMIRNGENVGSGEFSHKNENAPYQKLAGYQSLSYFHMTIDDLQKNK